MKSKVLSLVMASIFFSGSAFAEVVKSFDDKNNCTLYRATQEKTPRAAGETTILLKDVYGLSIQNMEIDFNAREVKTELIANVVMGINRKIVNDKVIIQEQNSEFTALINQLNRKVFLFEKACVNADNVLVYATQFPTED